MRTGITYVVSCTVRQLEKYYLVRVGRNELPGLKFMFPPGIKRTQAREIQLKQTWNFVLRNEICVLCAFSDYKYKDISAWCMNPFPGMNYTCNKNILSYISDTKAGTLSLISLCIQNINLTNRSFRIHVIYEHTTTVSKYFVYLLELRFEFLHFNFY